MPRHIYRIVRAALVALAAGALVAVANPVRPIDRDVSIAMRNVGQLAVSTAAIAGRALAPKLHA